MTRYATLLSYYGPLLSEDGRRMMQWYYEEDLSLAEISAVRKMSRQAVSSALDRQRRLLDKYEGCLHLTERDIWLKDRLSEAMAGAEQGNMDTVKAVLTELRRILTEN